MSISFWQNRVKDPELVCDLAIVGAGIVGASTAYWITRLDPECRVALIDAHSVASGASGRNAGFLLQGAASDYVKDSVSFGSDIARRLWRFTRENRDLIFDELGEEDLELESSGSMVVAGSEEEDVRLRQSVRMMRADGAPSTYFAPEETNRRLSSNGFFGGLYVPAGAMVNPVSLVRRIAAGARATLLEYTPVRGVEMRSEGVYIDTERRVVRADNVVLAVNAWLPRIFPELSIYIAPRRAQMLASAPIADRWLDVPVYSHDGFFYVRQAQDGSVLAGGGRHLYLEDEVGYDDAVTHGVQQTIEEYLTTHFPAFGRTEITSRWGGIMGFSPDHLPIVGDVPGVPGSVWAGGFSGHGMGFGFRFGRMLAELVLGRSDPEGLDLFSSERFAESALAQGIPAS